MSHFEFCKHREFCVHTYALGSFWEISVWRTHPLKLDGVSCLATLSSKRAIICGHTQNRSVIAHRVPSPFSDTQNILSLCFRNRQEQPAKRKKKIFCNIAVPQKVEAVHMQFSFMASGFMNFAKLWESPLNAFSWCSCTFQKRHECTNHCQ